MRASLRSAALLAAAMLLAGQVHAQGACSDGRTAAGTCVKADLAQSMRKGAVVATQPKLSFTSPPVLPSEDYEYRPLPDFKGIITLFGTDRARRQP
jgi:hypothetical protein